MKKYSSHFIFTNTGKPLRRAVITTDDEGTITAIRDTNGNLREESSVEFLDGIIVPGFVNCHCHLELSHLRGAIQKHTGLGEFLVRLQEIRDYGQDEIIGSGAEADQLLYREGIVLCADICNNSLTFGIKAGSRVSYVNLLEVFASDPSAAAERMDNILKLYNESAASGIESWIVPHTPYAVSLTLFRLLKQHTLKNRITSIHFMETEGEGSFVKDHKGPLADIFRRAGMLSASPETAESVTSAILDEVTPSGNLILVHNTFADRQIVREVSKRKNLFWCLCPNANIYIENKMPPAEMLISEGCEIVIGTDSLASNDSLSILAELKTLQHHFPSLTLEDLVRWASSNGARALRKEEVYGTIELGKKPGLLLLENVDLINMRLQPETTVKRLI